MSEEIVMPRLSDTMETGTVARWLKREGDSVRKGDQLAEIETDKATMPLESYATGTLDRILLAEGESASIGTPIAVVVAVGEKSKNVPPPTAAPESPRAETAPTGIEHTESELPQKKQMPIPKPPEEQSLAPVLDLPDSGTRASPLARRLAEEHGISLGSIRGTGPAGRITREDVEAAVEAQSKPASRAAPPPPAAPVPPTAAPQAVPASLTRMQSTIAQRMTASKTTVPHFYVTSEIDVSAAAALRKQLNASWSDVHVGVTDLVVKAVGLTLRSHPIVNASWNNGEIVRHDHVNVGVAVPVENGLLVPVLHDVDKLDLRTLSKQLDELIQRTLEGRSAPADFHGGTFTVSNLGLYHVDEFSAIISPPESGILAVGRIEKKPVARDGQIVLSDRMRVTLSGDHRVFYGVHAAEFLGTLVEIMEQPLKILR